MSDFFTRLAERTLGLALTIQPIEPLLFAPDPDVGDEMPFEIVATQTVPVGADLSRPSPIDRPPAHAHYSETSAVQPERSQAEAPRSAAVSAQAQHTEASAPRSAVAPAGQSTGYTPTKLSVNGTLSQTDLHRSSRLDRRRPPTVESLSLDSTYTRESTPVTGKMESAVQQSSLNAQPTIIPRTHPESNDESLPSHHTESGQNSTISAINKEPAAIPPTQMSVRQMPVGEREAESGRVGLYGRPWVEGGPLLHAPVSPPLALQAAPTPESTVHVTIGRVEVRAVNAPATTTHSQQQPAKPPAMSLDEYLHRQEQGGRR